MLFAAGFAGSFHCIGMCGGFACAIGRDPHGHGATVLRHLLYNTGRLTTYCFLGVLAGALVGARLLAAARTRVLRVGFAVVITVLAVEMIYNGVRGRI